MNKPKLNDIIMPSFPSTLTKYRSYLVLLYTPLQHWECLLSVQSAVFRKPDRLGLAQLTD